MTHADANPIPALVIGSAVGWGTLFFAALQFVALILTVTATAFAIYLSWPKVVAQWKARHDRNRIP